jgi:hypothetical protein
MTEGHSETEDDDDDSKINDDDNEAMEEDLWDFEKEYDEEELEV